MEWSDIYRRIAAEQNMTPGALKALLQRVVDAALESAPGRRTAHGEELTAEAFLETAIAAIRQDCARQEEEMRLQRKFWEVHRVRAEEAARSATKKNAP